MSLHLNCTRSLGSKYWTPCAHISSIHSIISCLTCSGFKEEAEAIFEILEPWVKDKLLEVAQDPAPCQRLTQRLPTHVHFVDQVVIQFPLVLKIWNSQGLSNHPMGQGKAGSILAVMWCMLTTAERTSSRKFGSNFYCSSWCVIISLTFSSTPSYMNDQLRFMRMISLATIQC